MAAAGKSIKRRLGERLAESRPARITEGVWKDLLAALAPVSESYLRELLRATGLQFDLPYAGVRQSGYQELEESLLGMARVHAEAKAEGDRELARYCRRQVIGAKDRARFVAARPGTNPEKKAQKEEMARWMLVWLENPDVFPAWVDARKRALQ